MDSSLDKHLPLRELQPTNKLQLELLNSVAKHQMCT